MTVITKGVDMILRLVIITAFTVLVACHGTFEGPNSIFAMLPDVEAIAMSAQVGTILFRASTT